MTSKPDRDGPFPQNQQIPQGYPPPGYPFPPQDPFYGAPGAPPPAYGYPPPPGYGYQQQPQGYYGQQPNYQGGIMAPPQQGYYGGQRPQSGGWLQGCLQALCCCCLMDECVGNCPPDPNSDLGLGQDSEGDFGDLDGGC